MVQVGSTNLNGGMAIYLQPNGTWSFAVNGSYFGGSSYVAQRGSYYEVTVTYAGGTNGAVALFINGQKITTSNPAALPLNTANLPLIIGSQSGNAYYTNGNLNDVCLWDVALTPAQVQAMWQTGIKPYTGTAHLVREYILAEGAGTTPKDSSLNADTSTSVGLTWSTNTMGKARPLVTTPRPLVLL